MSEKSTWQPAWKKIDKLKSADPKVGAFPYFLVSVKGCPAAKTWMRSGFMTFS
jgi:hypothetical protein